MRVMAGALHVLRDRFLGQTVNVICPVEIRAIIVPVEVVAEVIVSAVHQDLFSVLIVNVTYPVEVQQRTVLPVRVAMVNASLALPEKFLVTTACVIRHVEAVNGIVRKDRHA
jgi:hypothetical protein